ncbi:MAG: 3-oxoadipate enol-lactonase [Proteobacteria bacterium]|nr:3-oxoadipate enol-lactonase [Pseudomonadota bacterium]
MDWMLGVNGTALHARIDGPDGAPWLVLSNSLGATLEMWQPQVAAFSRDFRVLRYDTRGHGGSAVPPGPYTIEQLGSDVVGLLDTLGIARAHFCGLSMGGATGMWLAVHASSRIDRLVLCNTTPWLGPPEVMDARIATMRRDGMAALVEGILQRWFTADAITHHGAVVERIRQTLLQTPIDGYVGCCEALRDMDQRAELARIAAPTLVIAGTFDPAPTPATAREWASMIPNARCMELSAAHLSNIGAAAEFNEAVPAFLGKATRGNGSAATCS